MRIAEVFQSIQGEGRYAGTPSAFVRATGCNLRCWFCDTPYTSWRPEGERLPWRQVIDRIHTFDCEHVVLTGGEPLLQPEIVPLAAALQQAGHFVTVETAATVDRPITANLMSISPKLSNSTPHSSRWANRHDRVRVNDSVLRRLIEEYDYQLKFVVDSPGDLAEIQKFLDRFPQVPPDCVWLMPQGIRADNLARKADWLEPAAERLGYHFCPRIHIELYGNAPGR